MFLSQLFLAELCEIQLDYFTQFRGSTLKMYYRRETENNRLERAQKLNWEVMRVEPKGRDSWEPRKRGSKCEKQRVRGQKQRARLAQLHQVVPLVFICFQNSSFYTQKI